jgi:hypothetical protein
VVINRLSYRPDLFAAVASGVANKSGQSGGWPNRHVVAAQGLTPGEAIDVGRNKSPKWRDTWGRGEKIGKL